MNSFFRFDCSVYEIYPQSEMPHLTQIAHLDFDPTKVPSAHLLPDSVIWYDFYERRVVFRVWDYRMNHSMSFSVDVEFDRNPEVHIIHSKVL